MSTVVSIVGGGLAGSECAYQLAEMGYQVHLYEMRDGDTSTPAHKTQDLGELVCSNSFGSQSPGSAPAQLKWEAEKLNSFVLAAAQKFRVEAGQALAVDRVLFAQHMTEMIEKHPRILVIRKKITCLNGLPRPLVIATGPLTDSALASELQTLSGKDSLYFFDAIAPIISAESINMEIAWKQDRYDKGTPDYINCPLDKTQYQDLIREIEGARKITPHHFEETPYFEGCMPIEAMIERGPQTLRFGPMKPVGLTDPRTGRRPYAVVQLRKENAQGTSYNMVGFQTRMAYGEQVRILRMIPGLENAEFLKLGSIHRNLYVNTPTVLNEDLSAKLDPLLFLAGQITGVEGYFESACIGLLVARMLNRKLNGLPFNPPPLTSALGALLKAITDLDRAKYFQPTNINFGLLPKLPEEVKAKDERKAQMIARAQIDFMGWLNGESSDRPQELHIQNVSEPQLTPQSLI